MKSTLVLLASFFILVPLFLFTIIFYQSYLYHQSGESKAVVLQSKPVKKAVEKAAIKTVPIQVEPIYNETEAIPASGPNFADIPEDKRVTILKDFFGRYNSPLTDYAQAIVDTADNYGLDWRLLPAIAMQESTLCKRTPTNSFNCWGFGIYGGKVTRFSNYNEAIETVSKTLARDYKSQGLSEPHEIMTRY